MGLKQETLERGTALQARIATLDEALTVIDDTIREWEHLDSAKQALTQLREDLQKRRDASQNNLNQVIYG